jgi:predicted MFS family arabinose efflux permease
VTAPGTRWHAPAVVVAAGCVVIAVAFGTRAAMGLFLEPMTAFHGWSRADFALALAVQNLLWGVCQPFAGALADRVGAARVLAVGLVVYALGVVAMAMSTSPLWLVLTAGVVIGLAQALAAFSIVLSAFARLLPEARRSWAFGMGTAAGSLGQFLVVPLGQAFIAGFGWSDALWLLGLCLLVVLPLTWFLRSPPSDRETGATVTNPLPVGRVLAHASGHRSYVLLVLGFFVCGFHVAFIAVHLPAHLGDAGFDPALAAWALSLIGLFNVVGSYGAGVLAGRWPKRTLLAGIYLARAVVLAGFMLLPQTAFGVYVFAALMGLLWLSTVPPTTGLVAVMFGVRHMAMLFGIVFFGHQLGAFVGVWLGGWLYAVHGTYDAVWWLGVGLALAAAAVHWPIRERAVAMPA